MELRQLRYFVAVAEELPSHVQAARIADGSLDLAVCWVRTMDLAELGLRARPLYAVACGCREPCHGV